VFGGTLDLTEPKSWIKLLHIHVNVFQLTWVMSLQ